MWFFWAKMAKVVKANVTSVLNDFNRKHCFQVQLLKILFKSAQPPNHMLRTFANRLIKWEFMKHTLASLSSYYVKCYPLVAVTPICPTLYGYHEKKILCLWVSCIHWFISRERIWKSVAKWITSIFRENWFTMRSVTREI